MDSQLSDALLKCLRVKSGTFHDIDQSRFNKVLSNAGVQGETGQWFKKIDTKGDGVISLDEIFSAVMGGHLVDRYSDRFSKLDWTADEFSCHNEQIDKEHQTLFDLINSLNNSTRSGKIQQVEKALHELRNYAEVHLNNENQTLRDAGIERADPSMFDIHNKTYRVFVERLKWYESRFRENDVSVVYDILTGELNALLKISMRLHIRDVERSCNIMRSKGVCQGCQGEGCKECK